MVKRYRTFLKELSKLPIEEQGVNTRRVSFCGNHDQVDDICVMGIKFKLKPNSNHLRPPLP